MIAARYELGPLADAVEAAVTELVEVDAVGRLWAKDHTLFSPDPDDNANRMGWLDTMAASRAALEDLAAFAAEIAEEADHVILMGMGGSSLFPEVLARTFGSGEGYPQLHILDTTNPTGINRILEACPPDRTFHLASSKSGSTVETRSHLELLWDRSRDASRFAVVTDPGSALGVYARELGFRRVFEADPDIGGRYSALSLFGMVPGALIDVDIEALLDAADDQADALAADDAGTDAEEAGLHLGLRLGAAFGAASRAGRDKLTILLDDRLHAFGPWLEQLIAESTGKHGVGIVPIVDEPLDIALAAGHDRLFVTVGDVAGIDRILAAGEPLISLTFEEDTDLGAQVFLWEFAVALSGKVLGINPFDQPDVEAAKVEARKVLDSGATTDVRDQSLDTALAAVRVGDYVAVCAFVDPGGIVAEALPAIREALGSRLGVATTAGIGPRFLHSTGQLHKGGGADVVVLQVLEVNDPDLAIPGQPHTFGRLAAAQAAGDLAALAAVDHRAFRVSVTDLLGLV